MKRDSAKPGPAAADAPEAARPENRGPDQRLERADARRRPVRGQAQEARSRREILHEALAAAQVEHRAQTQRFEAARTQLQALAEWQETGRPQREVLRESAFARMRAKLESLPVIEQAKGILMAQQRCGPEEAFDLLRRASQRANVKVSVLAAQIVEQTAAPAGHSVMPAQPPASEHLDQPISGRTASS